MASVNLRFAVLAMYTWLLGAAAADPEAYLRYAHPTVTAPFVDLINLAVPPELGNRRLAELGYVDVTAAPFRADPTGREDATAAIQAAVNFARDHQLATFFPTGTYRVSDTIECILQLYRRANGRVFGAPLWPNVLVGSRAGARPKLLLAPGSPGFGDPAKPKIMLSFWARGYANPTTADRVGDGEPPDKEQPNISFNQVLSYLEIVVGEGNPGAIAVRHQAAEGSGLFDCVIDATGGHTGLHGGIGSGGSSAGVTVLGGRYGVDLSGGYGGGTQPTPCLTGFTLRGQTVAAIRSTSRQTLVATGLTILAEQCAGPLIQVGSGMPANHGELTLVDARVEFAGAALRQPERVVIDSGRGVYLHHVYVRGATQIVRDPEAGTELPGDPADWLHVAEYARAASPRENQGLQYRYPVYVDGRSVEGVQTVTPGRTPPADLQARHLPPASFPSFETPGAINVKAAPYGARGDGLADDTDALQRALDAGEVVFLPKGCYRLTRPLELTPRSKLIGVGQTMSFLVATGDGAFAEPERPAPLVRTADTAAAETILAHLGLTAPKGGGVQAIHWRSGGSSVVLSVAYWRVPHQGGILITGQGGGNWYNTHSLRVVVEGARGPLRFYQFSPQQVINELRGARDVAIFGTKYEGNNPLLVIRDCDRIALFGHGGNAKALAGGALFVIENTPHFLVANAVDGPTKIGSTSLSHPQGSTHPSLWHMLIERSAGVELKLPPLERPVLYRRGSPTAPARAD